MGTWEAANFQPNKAVMTEHYFIGSCYMPVVQLDAKRCVQSGKIMQTRAPY